MLEYDRIGISVCQKNVIFVTIGILKILALSMRSIFAMVVMI